MIAFRLDANEHVATGHMFRCIAIAKQCRKLGMECIFLLADESNADILRREGMPYQMLELKWDDWDYGVDILEKSLREHQVECLVVDSYKVTSHFFEKIPKDISVLYLDDICTQPYRLSAALHYSEWEDESILKNLYRGTVTKVYSGMQYMPLQEKFCNAKTYQTEKTYDLLITTGGSDPHHISLKLLQRIVYDSFFHNQKICVVLGKMNKDKEAIEALTSELSNITILQNISNMEEIMCHSAYAITAAGTTVYELMACGVAFVCFGFSEDQKYFGERLAEHGNALWAGDVRQNVDHTVLNMINTIKELQNMEIDKRKQMIQNNQNLIDGYGAKRIAEIIHTMCEDKDENILI